MKKVFTIFWMLMFIVSVCSAGGYSQTPEINGVKIIAQKLSAAETTEEAPSPTKNLEKAVVLYEISLVAFPQAFSYETQNTLNAIIYRLPILTK